MAYNKIIFGGNTLIDLTQDDVTAADVLAGKNYHGRDGEAAQGSMNNRGAVTGTIASKAATYTIAQGYHNGSGTVQISSTEQAKIIAGNIKHGVSILGVTGNYNGDGVNLQSKTASFTPSASAQSQTVTADTGYDGLQQVAITVAAIPYVETANQYGTTVTIG